MTEQSADTTPAESDNPDIGRLVRFVIVGGATALIYVLLLYLLLGIAGISYVLASGSSHAVGLVFNYLSHYFWTFDVDHPHSRVSPRYLVMHGCSFLINLATVWLGADLLELNYLLVQGVAILLILASNFALSVFWVYRPS